MVSRTLAVYIGRHVAVGILTVGVMLLAVYSLIELVREAGDLQAEYGLAELLWYLALTTPTRLYEIFPFAALIGTLLALGWLAGGQEITAMRAGGFDRGHVAACALAAGLLLGGVVMWMGEALVPELDRQARVERGQARGGGVSLGGAGDVWLRDGALMAHVDLVSRNAGDAVRFTGLTLYELGSDMKPVRMIVAPSGRHDEGQWILETGFEMDLERGRSAAIEPGRKIVSRLEPEIFTAVASRPRLMSLADLDRVVGYLEANALDAQRYRQAFWRRVYYPAGLVAMILVGIPMVFRPAREFSTGLSVFAGVALGLLFFVTNRIFLGLALVWPLPVWFGTLLPALLFAVAGYWLLRRG